MKTGYHETIIMISSSSSDSSLMVRRGNDMEVGMKDLVSCIARALVDNPDEVAVTEIKGTQVSVIELKVAKEDIGKII